MGSVVRHKAAAVAVQLAKLGDDVYALILIDMLVRRLRRNRRKYSAIRKSRLTT